MQVRRALDLQGDAMNQRLGTRVYTFDELMKHLNSDLWYVHKHGREQYTFVPVQYRGK